MGFVALVSMLSAGLVAAVLAAVTWTLRRRRRSDLLARLRADWGNLPDRDRDYPSLVDFHHARKDDGPSIDDRTWEDLHLDAVFTVLDHTQSTIGQQALYHRLRTPFVGPTLRSFDTLVNLMGQLTPGRERAQAALARLGDAPAYDLWRFAKPGMSEQPSGLGIFPLFAAGTLLGLILTPVWPVAILGAAATATAGLLARTVMARRLRVPLERFRGSVPSPVEIKDGVTSS